MNHRAWASAGVRLPAGVSGLCGNGDDESAETYGHVYGHKRLLRPVGHLNSPGIRRVSVPRVFVSAVRFSGRQFHNQRLSFSSVNGRERYDRGIFGCVRLYLSSCAPYYVIDMLLYVSMRASLCF